MKVLILAGGYGTRLYPMVKDIPKALLDINGKVLIDFVIDKILQLDCVDEVIVVTNEKFYSILNEWAHNKKNVSFPIRVVNDGTTCPEDRLGAVGDMQYVFDQERATDWLVMGSDNLFDYAINDFVAFAKSNDPSVSIGLYDVNSIKSAKKYGVVSVDQERVVIGFDEKPESPKSTLITMCMYYFPEKSLPEIKRFLLETGSRDAAGGYIEWLYQQTKVYGFKFSGKWYDIGSIESYQQAQKCF